jgi:hypothetical protein
MNFPSADQSLGTFRKSDWTSTSSAPPPLAALWYRFPWPSRNEAKRMCPPSGDQTGLKSGDGSKVKRVGMLRARSINQMSLSPPPGTALLNVTRLSSGESHGTL